MILGQMSYPSILFVAELLPGEKLGWLEGLKEIIMVYVQ